MKQEPRPGARGWLARNELRIVIVLLIALFLLAFLAPRIFIPIHSGQGGVKWSRFFGGTQVDRVYGEGLHIIFPWDIMYIYDLRMQQKASTFDVLSADGLRMEVNIAVRYRPVRGRLGVLHKYVGPDYFNVVLVPEVGSHARLAMSHYQPEEIYYARRDEIQRDILARLGRGVRVRAVNGQRPEDLVQVEGVFIRSVLLPPMVREAIDHKLSQKQLMLEYDYRLQKEEKEKARKVIEAEGIRMFQDIVSEGISERYLRWKGIDATLELARSENSKVVVIGASEDGLPVILGNLDTPPVQPRPQPTPPPRR